MIVLLAIAIVGTFVGGLLVLEANAWLPYSSSRLLGRTLARLPEGLDAATRARWSEEIEADLASYEDRPSGACSSRCGSGGGAPGTWRQSSPSASASPGRRPDRGSF
jgi:hypothetical protein